MARRLTRSARFALAVIASDPAGVTESLLLHGHGYSRALLTAMARSGLVEIRREVVVVGTEPVEVGKVYITQAGRKAVRSKS